LVAYVVLIVLTAATVSLSLVRVGRWHLAVGMAIAAVKAGLVVLVFMHLARSPARTWMAAFVGLFWLGILFALTLTDYLVRFEATY